MQVDVYDTDLTHVGRIYTWISLVWDDQYNTEGSFQIELQLAEGLPQLFKLDRYCKIDISDAVMVIKSIDISENTMIINGYPATHILSERIFTDTVKSGVAETMIRNIVSKYCLDWPCLALGTAAGLTSRYEHDVADGTVLEKIQVIAQDTDIGFRIRKSGNRLLFECFQPKQNPNLKFATRYGNLGNVSYANSTIEYKNVAFVAGAGEGDDRIHVIAGDTAATGINRREMYIDARDLQQDTEKGETLAQYKSRLEARGIEALLEQIKIKSITFLVVGDVSMGDIVTVMLDELGITVVARVVGITITSQNNVITKEINVGTPLSVKRS